MKIQNILLFTGHMAFQFRTSQCVSFSCFFALSVLCILIVIWYAFFIGVVVGDEVGFIGVVVGDEVGFIVGGGVAVGFLFCDTWVSFRISLYCKFSASFGLEFPLYLLSWPPWLEVELVSSLEVVSLWVFIFTHVWVCFHISLPCDFSTLFELKFPMHLLSPSWLKVELVSS